MEMQEPDPFAELVAAMVALSLEEYSDDPDDSDDNISVFSGYAQVTWSFSEIRNS